MDTLGKHLIAELDGCDAGMLTNVVKLRDSMLGAAMAAGATILADEFFQFKNGGVSGFVLLAESHISIHTWPEHQYAAVDIYTCGVHTMPERACHFLAERLRATHTRTSQLDRGLETAEGEHEHVLVSRVPRPHFTVAKSARSA
jgi:S-adenosylmethionine decarboxylase